MLQKIKSIFSYKIENPLIIVDVGCRWGFADKFIKNANNILVFGFDPDIEECSRLEKLYEHKNVKLVPVGLSDKQGKRSLYLTNEPACSSLYKPNKTLTNNYPSLDCAKETSTIEVEVSTLDVWAEESNITYIDYIKIDTQGSELDILKGGIRILESIRFIEVEVEFNPIYSDQPLFSDVDLFLRKHGFVLWRFSNLVHYAQADESEIILKNDTINYDNHRLEHEVRGGQIYWADAFYIKKEIVDVQYSDNTKNDELFRDIEVAKRLGFLDLVHRLEKYLKS